jgi:hypothetical protein
MYPVSVSIKGMATNAPIYLMRYIAGASVYGGVRKTYQLKDATLGYDSNKKPLPMLIGDKLLVISVSSVMGYLFAPIWVLKDLNSIHRKIGNIPDVEYSSVEPPMKKYKRLIGIYDMILD